MKPTLILPVREFCHAVKSNRLFADLETAYRDAIGCSVSQTERASWNGSLPRLSGLLELCELPDTVLVGLEVQLPYYSERIDAILYGLDTNNQASLVLIELKQWSSAGSSADGRLTIMMRNGPVQVVHPSLQVDGYRRHLLNFVRAFHNPPSVQMAGCVYAHNYPERSGPLFEAIHEEGMTEAPVFSAVDVELAVAFIKLRVGNGNGSAIADRIRLDGFAPSRLLIDRAADLIRNQNVFTMLDEQIPAQKSIISAVRRAVRAKSKTIILVEGGPGTGKSVIALDALGHALRNNLTTFLVSGSAAFTHGMRRLLGPDLAPIVRFTDFFWDRAENSVDVLIVDEAHRIRSKSQPKVISEKRPKISQLEELIRAAKVTVLFMDTNQIIEPDEAGDPQQVAVLAKQLGIQLVEHHLQAQFRCDGSADYLEWVDDIFGLAGSDVSRTLQTPEVFDFDVFDAPQDVLDWVRVRNLSEPNSARLTAGWCWPWSDPLPDGTLVNDIAIGEFAFPWELKNGKRGAAGIPEAKFWAIESGGAEQAGTVYSVQGFEFRHVGVLMGPDLVVRDGHWVANPKQNFRNSIRGKASDIATIYLRRIYRTLFTRPLRSIRVYSVDDETRVFLRARIERQ